MGSPSAPSAPSALSAVRVVAYNAHMGDMQLSLRARHAKILDVLLRDDLAPSTIFMIQEAGKLLALLATSHARNHVAFHAMGVGKPMGVLTLVPKTLVAEGAEVESLAFTSSPMRRQCHLVLVRGTALVNAHLESCADGAKVREQQVREIGSAVQKLGRLKGKSYGYGVFGDLNGYHDQSGRRVSHVGYGVEVSRRPSARFPSLSPHKLRTFYVRAGVP